MIYKNIIIEGMESIPFVLIRDLGQTLANTIMNIQVLCNAYHNPEANNINHHMAS
jgi:hypothetical protein